MSSVVSQPILVEQFVNPKRRSDGERSLLPWSQYYPGFSESFAYEALRDLNLMSDDKVLDPWNGSGTTTSAAHRLGLSAIGIDINPAMKVVATARSVVASDLKLAEHRLDEIRESISAASEPLEGADEPLMTWFVPQTSAAIRSIANAIHGKAPSISDRVNLSATDAMIFLALFATVRQLMARFRTSNPTWIRNPRSGEELVFCPATDVLKRFEKTCFEYFVEVATNSASCLVTDPPELIVASANRLPLVGNSIASVLTSPPYCTRIDYAVACKPELAVLGFPMGAEFRCMRDSMLGTSTITNGSPVVPLDGWGSTCLITLEAVRNHYSKASSTYYLKTLSQYFDQLYRSISELLRVVDKGGNIIMVVQDSFYKDLHVDLAKIVQEMFRSLGGNVEFRQDFPATVSMRWVNSRSRAYRPTGSAVETVLKFEKQ